MKHITTREVIASRNHPQIKHIRNLQHRSERDASGLFVIEGLRFVAQAVEHKAAIQSIVYAPTLLTNTYAKRLVSLQRHQGTRCLAVTPEVLHSLALNDDPQGILAVVGQRWSSLESIKPTEGLCWLALETIQSPGNMGTIIRTCDAVGAPGLLLIGDSVDAYHPACVRASMGALFALQFVRASVKEFRHWKQQQGCVLVGTSPSAPAQYDALSYPSPLVLLMGGERKGLSLEQQQMCDLMVQIPMVGRSDSLNLGVATGVMLYEVLRQRRAVEESLAV
jgi:TrmH family RNA methyltransferase